MIKINGYKYEPLRGDEVLGRDCVFRYGENDKDFKESWLSGFYGRTINELKLVRPSLQGFRPMKRFPDFE